MDNPDAPEAYYVNNGIIGKFETDYPTPCWVHDDPIINEQIKEYYGFKCWIDSSRWHMLGKNDINETDHSSIPYKRLNADQVYATTYPLARDLQKSSWLARGFNSVRSIVTNTATDNMATTKPFDIIMENGGSNGWQSKTRIKYFPETVGNDVATLPEKIK